MNMTEWKQQLRVEGENGIKMTEEIKDMWEDYYERGIIGEDSYNLIMKTKKEETLKIIKEKFNGSVRGYLLSIGKFIEEKLQ